MRKPIAGQHCKTFHLVEQQHLEDICRMSDSEKWQRMILLTQLAEKRLRIDIWKRHPDISAYEVQMRVASHRIPADLMRKAYGWNPELTDDCYDKEHEVEEQLRQAHLRRVELDKKIQAVPPRAEHCLHERCVAVGDL